MSASEPANSVPVRGAGGMKLPLHSAGDHNGNAFPISSSSSSSSCLGESSPESLRSLSGGRTDSPLDYDMFDVTLTTVKTVTLKSVVSDWAPEEERNPGDDGDDTSLGKSQTVTESNDNSVSVYLDANGDDYHQDSWNDNLTLARSLTGNGGLINEDVSSGSSNGRRRSSSPPDSDATEVPADDDDEEEALFVSVSSDVDVQRSSAMISVVSDWAPEEERNPGDDGDDTSLGKSQTVTESNDNSVSVYLDANGDDYHQDSWNDNLTLARSLTGNGGLINEDVSSGSSNGRRSPC
ncbi:uncharacterized protein LOC121815721 [Haplochromis burtoni]|uniref:uncharacterized protein LOC121815721 n=1 Tax=Haplochromis burtoni TaxID=8153 RepID=UPI001C2D134E|nr:uncharacterized protein LOC121815721 [Haplochromis burtoni]